MRTARIGRERRGRVGVIVAMVIAGVLAACTSAPQNERADTGTTKAGPSTPAAPATRGNPHQRDLSEGETAAVTAELVRVPGYTYTDVSDQERSKELGSTPDDVTAAAFHGVTEDAAGHEIAFLALAVPSPTDAMFAAGNAERFGRTGLDSPDAVAKTYSGQQVWFAESPSRPNSRYQYTWLRHGMVGWLDGPEKEPLERFLAAYFAAPFRGLEDPVLAERMVDVPGYAFTNAVDRTNEQAVAEQLFPGSSASMHYLFDQTHSFAGLVLVGPAASVRDDELSGLVETWAAQTSKGMSEADFVTQPDLTAGDITIKHLKNPSKNYNLYIWRWPNTNVVGWLPTTRPDLAEPFLSAFVSAQPAAVGR